MRKDSGYKKTKGAKTHFKNNYYNDKKCFKYLSLFGIWYLVTLLIILKFLDEVMPPTPELINMFRFFSVVGVIFTGWSGYKYFSKKGTRKTYKHYDLNRLIKSNTCLLAILFVLIFAVVVAKPLITYLDIPIFILALVLAIKGTWSSMKRIDGIDLESDLYCWGVRILGLILFISGLFLFLFSVSGIAVGFYIEDLPLSAFPFIFPIIALCVMVIGIFCVFRSFRRYGYFVYMR